MKKIISLFIGIALLTGLSSCADWLDVNTDPDSPSATTATVDVRLPWIQYYYCYALGNANFRSNLMTQMYSMASRTATNSFLSQWDYAQGHSTTLYQNWFVGAAANIPFLIEKAEEEGANHYVAAGKLIKAMGSVMMVDFFGEMPFDEASNTAILAPRYDNGDYIYAECIKLADEAIKDFSKPQAVTATPLAAGDSWFGGNTQKWIKLAYGLKARWLMNMSKLDGFKASDVIDALANGPSSADEDLYATFTNVAKASYNITTSDAYGPNTTWDSAAWGTGQRVNRWYVNLLTNFKGTGVLDPRADKLLPSSMYNVVLSTDGSQIAGWSWLRDEGINEFSPDENMTIARHVGGNCNAYLTLATSNVSKDYATKDILNYYKTVDAFVAVFDKYYGNADVAVATDGSKVTVTYHPGAMYVNDTNPLFIEDIKYVQLRADALFETAGLAENDVNCYYSANSANTRSLGFVQGTGTFYTRPDSDEYFFTYAESCFIKAELALLTGSGDATQSYRDGIKAHFATLNRKLADWEAKGSCTTAKGFDVSFAYAPISDTAIDEYMNSPAVKKQGATMSDVMMQKFIALGCCYQNWNDMRKYNYYMDNNKTKIGKFGVVYTELARPAYRPGSNATFASSDSDRRFFPRRWMHSTHETNYNNENCAAAYAQYGDLTTTDKTIPSIPVFWDVE